MNFFPTITTTKNSNWKGKIKEAKYLNLSELAVFPTALNQLQRKKLYHLLEESNIKSIPFVHLRGDMKLWELDYLVKKYHTQRFNIHSIKKFPLIYDYSKYKHIIYIENTDSCLSESELKNFAGICLDFSHLENDRLMQKQRFEHNLKLIKKYPIGCNHISVIKKIPHLEGNEKRVDEHWMEDFSELDYLKNYPLHYFSEFCAIELENSLKEQLDAIGYIIKLISK